MRLISHAPFGAVLDAPRYLIGMKTLREAKERAEEMYPQVCGTWQKDKDNVDTWVKRNGGQTELWLFRGRRRR